MRPAILLAWVTGLGLVTWHGVKKSHKPVSPGQYAAASGLYVMLAMLAEYGPAAPIAVLMAWGFDLAVFLEVLPSEIGGPKTGTTQAPGTSTAAGRG